MADDPVNARVKLGTAELHLLRAIREGDAKERLLRESEYLVAYARAYPPERRPPLEQTPVARRRR